MISRLIFFLTLIFVIQSKNFINLNNQLSTSIQKSNSENELANQIIKKYGFSQFIFYDPEKYISDTNSMIDYMKQILNNHQIKVFFFILNEISNPENIDKYLSNVMNELETKIEKYSRLNNLGILILMEQNKYSYYLNSNNLNKKQIIEIINQNLNKKISKSNIESIIKDLLLKINKEIKQQNQILLSGIDGIVFLFIFIAIIIIIIIIACCMCVTTVDYGNDYYYVGPTHHRYGYGVHTGGYVNTNVNVNLGGNYGYNTGHYNNDYYYKNNDNSYGGGGDFGGGGGSYGGGGDFGGGDFGGGGDF